jgi:hypothetical protein
MKHWTILLSLVLTTAALTACGGAQATKTDEGAAAGYESDTLGTNYEGALDVSAQLALGSLQLEETGHAVTPEQAKTLLPLWQALQGGVTAEDEINAVLRGIEGAMTEKQLATIADMQLTQEDMQAWMEEQRPDVGGGFPGAGDMSEEEREAARATRQAESGGQAGPAWSEGASSGREMPSEMATRVAQFENMTEEEREAMMATAQAGGGIGAGFRGGAGDSVAGAPGDMGQLRFLLRPLITMLEMRAGEA